MATNEIKLSPEIQEHLVKISGTSYSLSGYAPTKSGWELTAEQICNIIESHTKAWLPDVTDVTLDINHKTGSIYAFVWIPSKSKNLCNNELNSGNSAINRTLQSFSPQLREFMDKFCAKGDKRIFGEDSNQPKSGMRVMIDRFMKLEFDESGYEFGKKFGDAYKKKTRIELTPHYSEGDNSRYGKLNYLEVTKSVRNNFNTAKPRPKRSYNAR